MSSILLSLTGGASQERSGLRSFWERARLWGRGRSKVFVIGRNKTGTTSMGQALTSLGFRLGEQSQAELLMEDWARRDVRRIVAYCKTADAFQDVPFSLPYTYAALDYAFPGSKFILTVRDSAQQWYESLTRFHTQLLGRKRLPTAEDLQQFAYRETGWLWRTQQLVYGVDEHSLYDREIYTRHYDSHNQGVRDYFRHRPEDLLVLNLSRPNAMQSLCRFLGIAPVHQAMPHLNRSQEAARPAPPAVSASPVPAALYPGPGKAGVD